MPYYFLVSIHEAFVNIHMHRLVLLAATVGALLLGARTAAAVETFTLEATITHRVSGPFPLRDGDRIRLEGKIYEMRIVPPDRLSFIAVVSGRVYGPVQTIEGRLIEIDGSMYAFSWRVKPLTTATQATGPRLEAKPRAPLPPMPQAPPRPEPIPIPPVPRPEPPKPRTPLPDPSRDWSVSLWYAPSHDTPVKWEVDGRNGNKNDLSRKTWGGAMEWHGWMAGLALSSSLGCGDILPRGMDVTESQVDDGDGWMLALGYSRPFLKRGGWLATGGARVTIRQEKADLTGTAIIGQPGTNDSVDVRYDTQTSEITLTEYALWLDLGLDYDAAWWGLYLDLSFQPLGTIDVEGGLMYNGEELSVGVERDQPMAIGVGAWTGIPPWRLFADLTAGTESLMRIGLIYDFR